MHLTFHENMKALKFSSSCFIYCPKNQNIPHEFQKFFLTRAPGKHNNKDNQP